MKLRMLLAFAAALSFTTSLNAATVTYDLQVQNTTFSLYASASLGDNFGIAAYGVPLAGGILSVDHTSPNATANGTFGTNPIGFTLVRSADNDLGIHASQDTIGPTPYRVNGFGQSAGNLASVSGVTSLTGAEQPSYGAPLLIA